MTIRYSKEQGFSIVEILIVLAIAGLIMLIIFLIIPQFMRVRRDSERKREVSYVASQLETYSSDNSDTYPNDGAGAGAPPPDDRCAFLQTYLTAGAGCSIIVPDPLPASTGDCAKSSSSRFDFCYHNRGGHHQYTGNFDEISIEPGHWCNVGGSVPADDPLISGNNGDNNLNNYAVWTRIEGGPVFCVDNKE